MTRTNFARVAVADLRGDDGAIDFAKLFDLLPDRPMPTTSLALVPSSQGEALTLGALWPDVIDAEVPALTMDPFMDENAVLQLEKATLPKLQAKKVEVVSGSIVNQGRNPMLESEGMAETIVPLGVRHVSALTLKLMLGRSHSDTLLEKKGTRWRAVDDNELIDLKSRIQYKIGQIFFHS